jgi:hypothetical protein
MISSATIVLNRPDRRSEKHQGETEAFTEEKDKEIKLKTWDTAHLQTTGRNVGYRHYFFVLQMKWK